MTISRETDGPTNKLRFTDQPLYKRAEAVSRLRLEAAPDHKTRALLRRVKQAFVEWGEAHDQFLNMGQQYSSVAAKVVELQEELAALVPALEEPAAWARFYEAGDEVETGEGADISIGVAMFRLAGACEVHGDPTYQVRFNLGPLAGLTRAVCSKNLRPKRRIGAGR